jgi:hypothetical protein
MKRFILLLFVISLSGTAFVQGQVVGGYFDKLFEMYEQGQWEDCAFRADRLLNRNKYSGDPELYLYLAMSYHQIYQDTALSKLPEYDDAYEDALKNLVRAKRKDRYGEYFPDNNFVIKDIVKSGVPVMLEYANNGRYSKAYAVLRRLMRLSDDAGLKFYQAALDFYNYNENEAEDAMYVYIPKCDSIVHASADYTRPLIANGMSLYFDFLVEEYEIDSARTIIVLAHKHFPEDTAIERRYNIKTDSLLYD